MRLTVILDDELWLVRLDDGWHLAPPWVRRDGQPAPGMVNAARADFRRLPADTQVDLEVWHRGCTGCEAIREMQRHVGGVGETTTVEHTHGAP